MAIVALCADLEKNVFAAHGVGAAGKPALVRPNVARSNLPELIASLSPCLIGMLAYANRKQRTLRANRRPAMR